ncbi:MAG TPA: HAD-IIIA family hydrolase [Planctomycetota bacterium]
MRIAQITDLHARHAMPGMSNFPRRRSREMFALLPRALAEIKRRGVDFLALTGDLLDVPDYILKHDDYYDWQPRLWYAEAEADYRALKQMLDGCGVPYMVLPGNHDLEAAFWRVFGRAEMPVLPAERGERTEQTPSPLTPLPRGGEGDRSAAGWLPLPHVTECGGYQIARICDREGKRNVPRRLDRERKLWTDLLGLTATGAALASGEKSVFGSLPQIHLQHYVITPELNQGYPHTYLEHEQIRTWNVRSGNVRLCLSGHYHPGTDLLREANCWFSTGPAFCEFPHPIRIYDVDEHGVKMETVSLLQQPIQQGKRAVFLDRDGVLSVLPAYRGGPEEMALIPGSADAVRKLHEAGFVTPVITMQACIGRGFVTETTVRGVNDRMCRLLAEQGGIDAQPDAIYYSIGAKEPCHPCYADLSDAKPEPVHVQRAINDLGLKLEGSYMIGDRPGDLELARRAGLIPILVRTGYGAKTESELRAAGAAMPRVIDDLRQAAGAILDS